MMAASLPTYSFPPPAANAIPLSTGRSTGRHFPSTHCPPKQECAQPPPPSAPPPSGVGSVPASVGDLAPASSLSAPSGSGDDDDGPPSEQATTIAPSKQGKSHVPKEARRMSH